MAGGGDDATKGLVLSELDGESGAVDAAKGRRVQQDEPVRRRKTEGRFR